MYRYSQREFRARLASQLFKESERLSGKPSAIRGSLSSRVHPAATWDHGGLERIEDKSKYCVPYSSIKRKLLYSAIIRKSLAELSNNSVRLRDLAKRKRREQVPRTNYGCKLCNMHICCWK